MAMDSTFVADKSDIASHKIDGLSSIKDSNNPNWLYYLYTSS